MDTQDDDTTTKNHHVPTATTHGHEDTPTGNTGVHDTDQKTRSRSSSSSSTTTTTTTRTTGTSPVSPATSLSTDTSHHDDTVILNDSPTNNHTPEIYEHILNMVNTDPDYQNMILTLQFRSDRNDSHPAQINDNDMLMPDISSYTHDTDSVNNIREEHHTAHQNGNDNNQTTTPYASPTTLTHQMNIEGVNQISIGNTITTEEYGPVPMSSTVAEVIHEDRNGFENMDVHNDTTNMTMEGDMTQAIRTGDTTQVQQHQQQEPQVNSTSTNMNHEQFEDTVYNQLLDALDRQQSRRMSQHPVPEPSLTDISPIASISDTQNHVIDQQHDTNRHNNPTNTFNNTNIPVLVEANVTNHTANQQNHLNDNSIHQNDITEIHNDTTNMNLEDDMTQTNRTGDTTLMQPQINLDHEQFEDTVHRQLLDALERQQLQRRPQTTVPEPSMTGIPPIVSISDTQNHVIDQRHDTNRHYNPTNISNNTNIPIMVEANVTNHPVSQQIHMDDNIFHQNDITEIHQGNNVGITYTNETLPHHAIILGRNNNNHSAENISSIYRTTIRGYRRSVDPEDLPDIIYTPLLHEIQSNPDRYGPTIPSNIEELLFVQYSNGVYIPYSAVDSRNNAVCCDLYDNGTRPKTSEEKVLQQIQILRELIQRIRKKLQQLNTSMIPSSDERITMLRNLLITAETFIDLEGPKCIIMLKDYIRLIKRHYDILLGMFFPNVHLDNDGHDDNNDDDDENNDDENGNNGNKKNKKKGRKNKRGRSNSAKTNDDKPDSKNDQSGVGTSSDVHANTINLDNLTFPSSSNSLLLLLLSSSSSSSSSYSSDESLPSNESDWLHSTDDEHSSSSSNKGEDDDDNRHNDNSICEYITDETRLKFLPLSLENIPDEVLCMHILQFVGKHQYRFVCMINQSFHTSYTTTFPEITTNYNVASIEFSKICFDDVHESQQPILCKVAAERGNLEVLQYLRAINCQWDNSTCAKAAKFGNLNILQWARENDCPWDTENIIRSDDTEIDNEWTILHYASNYGHLDIIRYILQKNQIEVDRKDCNGWTSLHYACKKGQWDLVEYLVNHGQSNVEATNNKGYTALHVAGLYNHLNIVQYLIKECHANVVAATNDGATVLLVACENGHINIVQYLVKQCNANIETTNNDGYTALHVAVRYNQLNMVQYLINTCHANVDATTSDGTTALIIASSKGYMDIVQYLIKECDANTETINVNGVTALFLASQYGHMCIIQYLIEECNANFDATSNDGWTALLVACENGHIDIVQYLIQECHAKLDSTDINGWTALLVAIEQGHMNIVQHLVQECHARVDEATNDGWTALHVASEQGQKDIIQYLINECHTTVDETTNDGWTALIIASHKGHLDIVQYLIEECSANAEATTNDGWTALYVASHKGRVDIVQYLVKHCHANVDATASNNTTAIFCASQYGHLEIVQYLVQECGANVNKKNNDGDGLLHCASLGGHLPVVKFLCENCNVNTTKNKNGEAPIDAAKKQGHNDVVEYLTNCLHGHVCN